MAKVHRERKKVKKTIQSVVERLNLEEKIRLKIVQDKSSQQARVLSQLLYLQANMVKEQKRVTQIINNADLTIYRQNLQIEGLVKENSRLSSLPWVGCAKSEGLSRKTPFVLSTSARVSVTPLTENSITVNSDSGCDFLAGEIMSDDDGSENDKEPHYSHQSSSSHQSNTTISHHNPQSSNSHWSDIPTPQNSLHSFSSPRTNTPLPNNSPLSSTSHQKIIPTQNNSHQSFSGQQSNTLTSDHSCQSISIHQKSVATPHHSPQSSTGDQSNPPTPLKTLPHSPQLPCFSRMSVPDNLNMILVSEQRAGDEEILIIKDSETAGDTIKMCETVLGDKTIIKYWIEQFL